MDSDKIKWIKEKLDQRHEDHPQHDAWILLGYVCGLAQGSDIPIEIIEYIDTICGGGNL